ncbi:spindle and kinetochore-associated protein 2 [Patella vulgata]|uniref:spindle and kinetochore-associated protein 2 n=1 Tax=Patella vulgata TaxID=6465 RepID=UPI0021809074|nr:spindle and kinetochore-associated protein 2 [Patella vulgata]
MEKSVETLEAMFQKADSDLNYLARKVEFELENSNENGESSNPAKMIEKINEIKKEYTAIAQDALDIQKTQKEAMDFFRTQLLTACQMVQKLDQQTGADNTNPPDLQELASLLNFDPDSLNKMMPPSTEDGNQASNSQTSQSTNNNIQPTSQSDQTASSAPLSAADLRSQSKEYMDISEEEFNSVSDLIRGRVKLADVNMTYQVLWRHFKEEKNKKPLKTADMHKMGLKVSGATGEAKLKVLRALKVLQMSSKGEVTLT